MIGHPKHSGPIRAPVIPGSHEPAEQKNYQTNPMSHNLLGISWLRRVSSTAERLGKTLRIAPSGYQGTFAPRNRVCEKTGDCPKRRARAWRFINDLREARWTVPRFFHRPNSKGQERTIEAAEPPRSRIPFSTAMNFAGGSGILAVEKGIL